MRRLGRLESAHCYRVTTTKGVIEVDADTPQIARAIAARNGYEIVALEEIV